MPCMSASTPRHPCWGREQAALQWEQGLPQLLALRWPASALLLPVRQVWLRLALP